MGRKKVFDGKLVSIGAKVTEKQMIELDDLAAKLGMKNRSDLFRAALTDYLRKHPVIFGYSETVTNVEESFEQVRVNACLAYKELEISLNNALTELKHLGEYYQTVCPRTYSNIECSEESCEGELKRAES